MSINNDDIRGYRVSWLAKLWLESRGQPRTGIGRKRDNGEEAKQWWVGKERESTWEFEQQLRAYAENLQVIAVIRGHGKVTRRTGNCILAAMRNRGVKQLLCWVGLHLDYATPTRRDERHYLD